MTRKQREYVEAMEVTPIVIATGYAGTSKTYCATRTAVKMLREGRVEKIVICRPPSSSSKSLGYSKGDDNEKMESWIMPVLDALKDDFSRTEIEYMVKVGVIEYQPLEKIKGRSFNKAFIVIDEAEDLEFKELQHICTRIGRGSTMVLAGDVLQSDLKESGLKRLVTMVKNGGAGLADIIDYVDFSSSNDIVRSEACKVMTLAFHRELGEL